MSTSTNPTQAQIATVAQALSQQYGIPVNLIMATVSYESNNQQYKDGVTNTNPSGAAGLMQIMPDSSVPGLTSADWNTNWQANMQAGVYLMNSHIQNPPGGNGGVTPTPPYSVNQLANGMVGYEGKGGLQSQVNAQQVMTLAGYGPNVVSSGYGAAPTQTYDSFQTAGITNPGTVLTTQPVTGQPITDTADLYPPYVITEGLDAVPWWLMKGGVTENPWLKQVPAPVTFEVMLPNRTMLSNTKAGNNSGTISIRLNASVSSFEVQSGHVVNKGLSRTGMHITMWGQEADLISGEANTGAFMNALGITSFLSVSSISAQLQSQIAKAFTHSKASLDYDTSSASNDLRIAARDAFMELLALFKANGVVWFRNSTIGSGTGATNPVGVDSFSPQTGLSNYQMNARTNDVMARGQVIMKFRNSMYLGYFKSLEYEMEAERPFYWKFRFVFQVEKTLTLNYTPMVVNTQAPYGPNSDG
jgi:hypothetical protein